MRGVRLSPADLVGLGLVGLRTRKLRAALSALGIAVGIATTVVVSGIPASSQQALLRQLTLLGTNTLKAEVSTTGASPVRLPVDAARRAARIGPVETAAALGNTQQNVRRTDRSEPGDGVGISVLAAESGLPATVNATVASGRFLDAATERFPTVVLGHQAASWLGVARATPADSPMVFIGQRWFTVVGVLEPVRLAPELDQAVMVGVPAARSYLGYDGHPSTIYLKAREDSVEDVRDVLGATVHPQAAGLVQVSRPSDALAAKRATQSTYAGLFLGLSGVAVLVGGIGVANTMIISVLERRREIGLHRALGASGRQIRGQFLIEAALLSGFGGLAGTGIGVLATISYALHQNWPPVLPLTAVLAGLAGALVIGVVAGVYPAVRASRIAPSVAMAAPG
ncbi:ABC transporter permease [Kineosporia succinea]|uniref:ABC transport system permease protein n=1 Tax=Kineosporia succinea TaxID=84632 RepID=A0ABT9PC99_9ACTN|nr:ABC transporter permease [Kineosporia succinea]MDP9830335.1 putative ABC transport system permease protein [Kineosporia succinea]